ncbi:ribosomal subunit interface protein [Lewinellaceae bacterium SD302]|nr:ribosomal subunit interface protein [Lewinellaceae bacterium SD302]
MQIHINQSSELAGNTKYLLNEKLEKLTTFYERIESATVHIKQDDGLGENEATINVRLAVPGPDIVAEASEETIEKSIAEVHDKLRRQLRKLKEKQNGRN